MELLNTRRSVPSPDLREPGPDAATLQRIFTAALRVPDHGALAPWRVQTIAGDARQRFAAVIAAAYQAEMTEPDAARAAKLAARPQQAPLLLVVSSRLRRPHKVPESEQLLSGGALCQNILLAAQAAGFSGFWYTGWAAYSPGVKCALGIEPSEHILGYIALGTASRLPPERPRPTVTEIVSEWRGDPLPQHVRS